MLKKIAVILFLLLTVSVAAGIWWLQQLRASFQAPLSLSSPITLNVPKGAGAHRVGAMLAELNLIQSSRVFAVYLRYQGKATQLQAGEYRIEVADSVDRIIEKMLQGEVVQHSVTLVEGLTFKEMHQQLMQHETLTILTAEMALDELLKTVGVAEGVHPEGQFFPDTYFFVRGDSDLDILKRAHRRLQRTLIDEWEQRSAKVKDIYDSPYEALIMASLIEKETGVPEERGEIAGVFVRRLQKRMRLQTDPTVIYGLGESFDGDLKRKHLRQPTPYNTYVIRDLPPTPIALVGREAINAALNPKDGDSYYFVAKGDGTHVFSATLKAHQNAVNRYQRFRRAKNYQSSPVRR